MEDRHCVSVPRPVDSNGSGCNVIPCWEIDILRDGQVVDTFFLNHDVLPPRTNKRGKIVWKLPETGDKQVSKAAKHETRFELHFSGELTLRSDNSHLLELTSVVEF